MIYGSVCSGIEAASAAWHPLGWKAAWLSEIEKFPSAVLQRHYHDVPNLGDMTTIHDRQEFKNGAIDLLVGGTPCQSFSVAGLRRGMADPRGNLALVFLRLADLARPRWIVWENVPGVLSSNRGRDFGAFLGALGQLGYGWSYRVLDAQFFGVPQRRRRVFVVGYLGDWRRAAAVLFEPDGLRRNPAPRGKARQDVAGTIRAGSGGGCGPGPDEAAQGNLIAHSLRGEGFDASEDGTGRGTPIIIDRAAFNQGKGAQYEPTIEAGETMPSLVARGPHAIGLTRNDPGPHNDEIAPALRASEGSGNQSVVAFGSKDSGQDALEDISPTLRAGGHEDSHQNGGVPPAVCYDMRGNGDGDNAPTLTGQHAGAISDFSPMVFEARIARNGRGGLSNVVPPLKAESGVSGKGDGAPLVFQQNSRSEVREMGDRTGAVTSEPGAQCQNYLRAGMAVRRLTPRECERLQGLPDDYTLVAWRGKPKEECPDGPRYKAIGNSMAVPVMRWIGQRIQRVDSIGSAP